MFRLAVLSLALGLATAYDDFEQICDKGFKVSEMRRDDASGGKNGGLEVVCDELEGAEAGSVSCEEAKPFVCTGSKEYCPANSWVGGVKGVELESSTGALLLGPVCCSSPAVKTRKCRMKSKMNQGGAAFDASLKSSQVYSGFKCWRIFEGGALLQDFIYKPNVCRVGGGGEGRRSRKPKPKRSRSPEKKVVRDGKAKERGTQLDGDEKASSRGRGRGRTARRGKGRGRSRARGRTSGRKASRADREKATCKVCSCRCGPFTCPTDKRRFTLVHRRRKRATCQCVCDCKHKCV